jgi:hypothetical protein
MLGVIDNFSNCIWLLLALPSKKGVLPSLSYAVTEIGNLHSRMHTSHVLRSTIKFDCGPNHLDVAYRTMASSLGYTAKFTAPYTRNRLAKIEYLWPTLADLATAML